MKSEEKNTIGNGESASAAKTPSVAMQARLKRIEDYRDEALREPDPRRAILGLVNADLFEFGAQTKQKIDELNARSADSLADRINQDNLRAEFIRLARENQRLAEFDFRLRSRTDQPKERR